MSGLKSRQRGAVFFLFIVLMIGAITISTLGLGRAFLAAKLEGVRSDRQLNHARAAVLAHLAQPELFSASGRLGQFSVLPDLPIAAGPGVDSAEPSYDGIGEASGCASRLWTVGQALAPVAVLGAEARCFGRLAWLQLGLEISPADPTDPSGDIPWLIASPNLAIGAACLNNLNPMMVDQSYAGYGCPSALPFPWIQVVDARGNLLSDRVAFALVMPGAVLPGQVRTAAAGPRNYLDSVTVLAGCAAPCRPGVYDNAGYNHANNQPWVLIQASGRGPMVDRGSTYQTPLQFNDRMLYVTVDALFKHLQSHALSLLTSRLQNFVASNGHYPFAAPFDAVDGACQAGLRFGHPPADPGPCGAAGDLSLPASFIASGWHRYFSYAVSPRCVSGSAACDAPGLTIDTDDDVDAIVFAPGRPRTDPPYTASRGAAQQPLLVGGALSAQASDWLDSIENSGALPDVFVTPLAGATPDNDRLYHFR